MSALFASSSIEAEQIARSMGMRIEPHLKPVWTRSPSDKFEDESQSSLKTFPPSDTFADSIVSSLGELKVVNYVGRTLACLIDP